LHTGQTRPGWVPPQPRDGGVLPADLHCPAGACRFPAASPTPRCRNPSAESIVTRHHQGFTHVHPSGLPLTCNSRMEQESSGLNPELRTPPLPATHVRAGTGHRTLTRDCTYGISRTPSPQPAEPEHPRVAHADLSRRTACLRTLPSGASLNVCYVSTPSITPGSNPRERRPRSFIASGHSGCGCPRVGAGGAGLIMFDSCCAGAGGRVA
jgi:hypothetical protein